MPKLSTTNICDLCRRAFVGTGSLCPSCKPKDTRKPSFKRGYDHEWRKVRAEVLRDHGIPQSDWHLFDIDHRPAYNKEIEPDHRAYELIPMLHVDHSRKTAQVDNERTSNGKFTGQGSRNGR